jgi:DNA mismatch repair protein MutS2
VNAHALEVLEFRKALALVAERATSSLGRAAVERLEPSSDLPQIRHELARVASVMALIDEVPDLALPPIPDVHDAIERLAVEGSVLEPVELFGVATLLRSARTLARVFRERPAVDPILTDIDERLMEQPELEADLMRSVDRDGEVLDDASKELGAIRRSLRGAHTRVVRRLEAYLRELPERFVVPDASVTVREGRYVIPLRREGKGQVGGMIHDESGTGATIFVEPPVAVELMNELRELERDEQREVRRILRELTSRLRPSDRALADALQALVELDALHARARVAMAWGAEPPELHPPGTQAFRLARARHPLLLVREEQVVPYDFEMCEGERTLVVSGPNTGGKSVFLKAMGLLAALAQSGVVPPLGKGSSLPVFDDIFADIGDEQSIAESLSTFSAHLENLKEIVASAGPESLVLIDEMGTGTDPTEGAALARSILESLTARGAFSIVTSHLGALKTLDAQGSGIVNASLQFDAERMEPTYQLVKGRPGRSYGLAIARRLGFPDSLLARAQVLVDEGAASLEDLLERLERRERTAAELQARLEAETADARRLREDAERREAAVARREGEFEDRARDDARQLLMDAREEVERAIAEVKAARGEAVDEAAGHARSRVEAAARRQARRPSRDRARTRSGQRAAREPALDVGDRVRLPGQGGTDGTVLEVRDHRATVEVGGVRLELPAADLEAIEGAPHDSARAAAPPRRERGWSGPVPDASYEIDLRGLRVDEVSLELGRGLDAALLAELGEVRVIHGKGTGAVRSRVQELLAADGRVRDHRLGGPGEGGSGVTVVKFA